MGPCAAEGRPDRGPAVPAAHVQHHRRVAAEEFPPVQPALGRHGLERGLNPLLRGQDLARERDPEFALDPVRLEAYTAQGNEFLNSIREDREPSVTGRDGRAAVAVALAAYQSAAGQKTIHLL